MPLISRHAISSDALRAEVESHRKNDAAMARAIRQLDPFQFAADQDDETDWLGLAQDICLPDEPEPDDDVENDRYRPGSGAFIGASAL